MIGGKHRSNMELVAQGSANIASALFGGIPATGAIARTVANVKNGGRTPVAGMVHSVTLLLILVIFMPYVKLVPLASLAAVLIIVAYNMSEWREFKGFFKSPKSDIAVLLLVFVLTVVIDLVKAIEIGLILAAFLFMKRMTDVSNVNNITMDASEEEGENFDFAQESKRIACPPNVQVYEINGPFFFGATDKFLTAMESLDRSTKTLILRMRNVPAMDATALKAFRSVIINCKKKHISLLITGINPQPLEALKKSGLYESLGEGCFFKEVEDAIGYAQKRAAS
jgi:SulP family sulfate permease